MSAMESDLTRVGEALPWVVGFLTGGFLGFLAVWIGYVLIRDAVRGDGEARAILGVLAFFASVIGFFWSLHALGVIA